MAFLFPPIMPAIVLMSFLDYSSKRKADIFAISSHPCHSINCQRGIFVPRLHNIQRNTVKGIINAGILSSSHRMSSALAAVLLLCAIPKWRNRTMKKTMPRKAVDTKRKVPGNKSTVAL